MPTEHKEHDLMTFMRDSFFRNGVMPTQAEMARHFGVSGATISERIDALCKKGFVQKIAFGHHRNIKIIHPDWQQPDWRGLLVGVCQHVLEQEGAEKLRTLIQSLMGKGSEAIVEAANTKEFTHKA